MVTSLNSPRIFATCCWRATGTETRFPLASFFFSGSKTVTPCWSRVVMALSSTGVTLTPMDLSFLTCWPLPVRKASSRACERRLSWSHRVWNQLLFKIVVTCWVTNDRSCTVTGAAMKSAFLGRAFSIRCCTSALSNRTVVAAAAT